MPSASFHPDPAHTKGTDSLVTAEVLPAARAIIGSQYHLSAIQGKGGQGSTTFRAPDPDRADTGATGVGGASKVRYPLPRAKAEFARKAGSRAALAFDALEARKQ
jgi:hypothetical protein